MKVNKLDRLLHALSQSDQRPKNTDAVKVKEYESGSTEAVKLSADFGRRESEVSADRTQRVEELKTQVQDGLYNPNTKEVAAALVKELMI